MERFDPLTSPLEGTNLIEASAGTGKTYTISNIFVRFILEKHISVEKILVVTFTKAATEELKDRIRNKLLLAKAGFLSKPTDDPFIDQMIAQYADSETCCGSRIRSFSLHPCTFHGPLARSGRSKNTGGYTVQVQSGNGYRQRPKTTDHCFPFRI